MNSSVLVIGGGLAGLAAASALAPRGFRVVLLESRNRLGGRASSFTDANTGQVIDACQHVSMGCCTQFAHFCRTVGIDHFLSRQSTLWFMTPDGRVSRFAGDPFPAPLHLARSLLRAHYLSLGEKIRIGWGLFRLLLCDPNDDQPLLPWLRRHRQTQRTIDRFWGVVLVSALNENVERLGLKYARKVFCDGFLRDRHGYEIYLPTVPLARLYGDELRSWFAKQNVTIEMNAAVTRLEAANGRVTGARLRDGRIIHADWYLAAVPFDRLFDILPAEFVESNGDLSRAKTGGFADFERAFVVRPSGDQIAAHRPGGLPRAMGIQSWRSCLRGTLPAGGDFRGVFARGAGSGRN